MTSGLWIVDAFTTQPFRGNPAGVCVMDKFPDDGDMLRIAAQTNLSETAFVVRNNSLGYDLRWFTPETEMKLCGHATLAAAHVLHQIGEAAQDDEILFQTISGTVSAHILNKAIELDFPTLPGKAVPPSPGLKALNIEFTACEKNRDNYLVEVKNYESLLACAPSFKKLAKMDAQGVIVTTNVGVPAGFDFASRYFAPAIGIDEDPVTGSAHCFLAPYWANKTGKTSFHAYQASKGQGVLDVTLKGERTLIAGSAVTTLRGDLPQLKKKKEVAA